MARKPSAGMREAAAAAAAAALAATAEPASPLLEDDEAALSEDIWAGLRRLDQGGNRVTWYVYCDAPVDREGYVEKLRTEQLDEARFKSKYGPGEYRVLGRTSDGGYVRGSHKTIKISDIEWDGGKRDGTPNDAVSLLRELRAADDKRAQQRAADLKTYATILATPVATIAAALLTRRPSVDLAALVTALRPQQSSLTEMTTAMLNLRQLEGGGGASGVDVVLKVLERIQDLPQGGDTGWLGFVRDIVREAAPHARELIGQLANPQGRQGSLPPGSVAGPPFGPGVEQAALPQPTPPPIKPNGQTPPTPLTPTGSASPPSTSSPVAGSESSPAVPTGEGEGDPMWRLAEPWLRRRAQDLHEWASLNMDVGLCAEMLLASVPPMFREVLSPPDLIALLQRPDWWALATAFHPPIAPYQAWIDDLRRELIDVLQHPDAPENERGEDASE